MKQLITHLNRMVSENLVENTTDSRIVVLYNAVESRNFKGIVEQGCQTRGLLGANLHI